jgi:hypothetical protein
MGLPLRRASPRCSAAACRGGASAGLGARRPYLTCQRRRHQRLIGKARDIARSDGQRKALAVLVERLSGTKGAATNCRNSTKALTDGRQLGSPTSVRRQTARNARRGTHLPPAGCAEEAAKAGIGARRRGSAAPANRWSCSLSCQSGAICGTTQPWRARPAAGGTVIARFQPLGDAGDIAAIGRQGAPGSRGAGQDPSRMAARRCRRACGAARRLRRSGRLLADLGQRRRYRAGQPVDDHPGSDRQPRRASRAAFATPSVVAGDIETAGRKPRSQVTISKGLTAVLRSRPR